MASSAIPRRSDRAVAVSNAAALIVACVAGVVLLGWIVDSDTLKGAFGAITMKTNTAIGLLLCAVSLRSHGRGLRTLGFCCAIGAGIIGALTLSEHVVGWNLGIDELLFSEPPGALATVSPNRMGPNGASSLVLAGCALVLLFRGTSRTISWAQRLSLVGLLLALLAVAGYLYGAQQLYAIAQFTGIAFHTAIVLVTLNIGILAARIDRGPMAAISSDGPAGTVLRRLAAPVVFIPLVLGYVVLLGREAELYDRGLGMALFAVSLIVVLALVLWHTARTIAVADAHRRHAEEVRDLLLVSERRARDDAERANRLKDQFIAILSHELRTPLNVMLGWTSVLEAEDSRERHARAAGIVARNGRMLARLVEDLLDLARVSSGQLEITKRPLTLNPVVQTAVDALAPLARQKGVSVVTELDEDAPAMCGDPDRLQQIVSNLLSNAVKFSTEGGGVTLRTKREGEAVVLTVKDSGTGFDPSFEAQLFQPFRQADSPFKREHGGLGLGLSIAKHLTELHGGSIAGTSAGRGRGATFTLRLPADTTNSSHQPVSPPNQTVLPLPQTALPSNPTLPAADQAG